METSREAINQWLEERNRDRQWLADKCGVSVAAVGHWLKKSNPRPVPAKTKIIIRKLMEEDSIAEKAKPPHNLVLEFNDEEYAPIEKAALKSGKTVRTWAKDTLNDIAEENIEELAKSLVSFPARVAPKTAGMMASAGTADSANNCEPQGIDLVNGTVPVRVTGMSMEPLFSDDDIITFRLKGWARSPYMKKGVIYLVEYNGGNLIKRYNTRKPKPGEDASEYLTGTGMVGVLESLNPEFPDIDITGPFDWVGWYDENFHKKGQ